jgi:phosphoribosylanthranilate isomerase
VPVKVKICGVRNPAIVETAAAEGADYVGFVFFEKSPRHLSFDEARDLAEAARGKIGTVAVLVDPGDALIDRVMELLQPSILQLHGNETPERVVAIKTRTGAPVMKAVSVAQATDVAKAACFAAGTGYVLFDAKAAPGARLPGGNGVAFDWRILKAADAPFALSGGLTPDNVAEAIRLTGVALVDVSSGVERAPGEKDEALVRRFIRAAKSAVHQPRAKAS